MISTEVIFKQVHQRIVAKQNFREKKGMLNQGKSYCYCHLRYLQKAKTTTIVDHRFIRYYKVTVIIY